MNLKKFVVIDTYSIILVVVLLLAFLIRVYHLTSNPPDLFGDELINYVSAKKILSTGADLDGKLLVYFSDRVELRPPVYGYTTALFDFFSASNVWAIRLPAVLYGVITVWLVAKIAYLLFNNKLVAITAAAALALMPWHIHYSRVGWEPAALLPYLLAGVYLVLKGIKETKLKWLLLGSVFLE